MVETAKYIIFCPPNGFDSFGELDEFSKNALKKAVEIYRYSRKQGLKVAFGITRCIVRNPRGDICWRVWLEAVQKEGVDPEHIVVSKKRVWNILTDGRAVLEIAEKNPEARIVIVVFYDYPISSYIETAYRAVAKHICGRPELNLEMHTPQMGPTPDAESRKRYARILRLTRWASKGRLRFLCYYCLRNLAEIPRLVYFTRTVKEVR